MTGRLGVSENAWATRGLTIYAHPVPVNPRETTQPPIIKPRTEPNAAWRSTRMIAYSLDRFFTWVGLMKSFPLLALSFSLLSVPFAFADEGGEAVEKVEPAVATLAHGEPIVVEAEHFVRQTMDDVRRWYVLESGGELPSLDGAGIPAQWTQSDTSASASASGKALVRSLPDTRMTHDDKLIKGTNFSDKPGVIAVLDYDVQFDRPGRYYVWVRAYSTGSEDNGLHVGLDGQWPPSGQRMQWCSGKNQWTWNCAQRTKEQHCGVPMQIFLDVDEPGSRTVSFSMREDGFAMDQFLLTTDINYRPDGAK